MLKYITTIKEMGRLPVKIYKTNGQATQFVPYIGVANVDSGRVIFFKFSEKDFQEILSENSVIGMHGGTESISYFAYLVHNLY